MDRPQKQRNTATNNNIPSARLPAQVPSFHNKRCSSALVAILWIICCAVVAADAAPNTSDATAAPAEVIIDPSSDTCGSSSAAASADASDTAMEAASQVSSDQSADDGKFELLPDEIDTSIEPQDKIGKYLQILNEEFTGSLNEASRKNLTSLLASNSNDSHTSTGRSFPTPDESEDDDETNARRILFIKTVFKKNRLDVLKKKMNFSFDTRPNSDSATLWHILVNDTNILVAHSLNNYYYWFYAQTVSSFVIFSAIVVGNTSILLRLKSWRRRRSNVNYFIIQLAIADLLVGVVSISVDSLLRLQKVFPYGEFACRATKFVEGLFLYSSTNLLVALSIDRWEAVVKPLAFTRDRSRGNQLVLGAWLLAIISATPVTFFTRIKEIDGLPQCYLDLCDTGWRVYMVYLTCLLLALPVLMIAICYTHIVYTIWSKGRQVAQQQRRQRQQQQYLHHCTNGDVNSDDEDEDDDDSNDYEARRQTARAVPSTGKLQQQQQRQIDTCVSGRSATAAAAQHGARHCKQSIERQASFEASLSDAKQVNSAEVCIGLDESKSAVVETSTQSVDRVYPSGRGSSSSSRQVHLRAAARRQVSLADDVVVVVQNGETNPIAALPAGASSEDYSSEQRHEPEVGAQPSSDADKATAECRATNVVEQSNAVERVPADELQRQTSVTGDDLMATGSAPEHHPSPNHKTSSCSSSSATFMRLGSMGVKIAQCQEIDSNAAEQPNEGVLAADVDDRQTSRRLAMLSSSSSFICRLCAGLQAITDRIRGRRCFRPSPRRQQAPSQEHPQSENADVKSAAHQSRHPHPSRRKEPASHNHQHRPKRAPARQPTISASATTNYFMTTSTGSGNYTYNTAAMARGSATSTTTTIGAMMQHPSSIHSHHHHHHHQHHHSNNNNQISSVQQHGSGVIPKARIKTIKMTLVIVVAYILCWSPFCVLNLLAVFGLIRNESDVSHALMTLTSSLCHLNSAVNPIIFWLFSNKQHHRNAKTSMQTQPAQKQVITTQGARTAMASAAAAAAALAAAAATTATTRNDNRDET